LILIPLSIQAQEVFNLNIKDHQFQPSEITIPVNTKVKLVVHNLDSTPEEFESHSMHREKIIPAGGKRTIFIGPLDAGTYEFFGEFNPRTAKGRVIAK
jgi:hypothetical protein